MSNTCSRCSRVNPPEAQFCYFDGIVLGGQLRQQGPLHMGTQPFPHPFVFPSGRQCRNFDQLALACQDDGLTAIRLVQSGDLPSFLSAIGRSDLAGVAREVVKAPNKAIGFDALLAALPSTVLQPPSLRVEPREINLGNLEPGKDRPLSIRLLNEGARLVYGNSFCEDAAWLSIGDANGQQDKLFQFSNEMELRLVVRGDRLSASPRPLEGKLHFRSSGGDVSVLLHAAVPVQPFSEGVLKDCNSPRLVAEKARTHPREAAAFFENGAIERWYKVNGWNYPIIGPSSSGLGAIQQFFEALGLAKAPKVSLSQSQVTFRGNPGERMHEVVEVRTQEKRNVFAIARTAGPWLQVECEPPKGAAAPISLVIPEVPDQPGETLEAKVQIHSNGNQRFELLVKLVISGKRRPKGAAAPNIVISVPAPVAVTEPAVPVAAAVPDYIPATVPASVAHVQSGRAVGSAETAIVPKAVAPLAPAIMPETAQKQDEEGFPRWLLHFAPLALLLLVLLVAIPLRDYVEKPPADVTTTTTTGGNAIVPIDPVADLAINMHDKPDDGPKSDRVYDYPAECFGLVMTREEDPLDRTKNKRLTYDRLGRSNNTCIRLDGTGKDHELLFGHQRGKWLQSEKKLADNKDRERLFGFESVWVPKLGEVVINVHITQTVELVAGGTRSDGKRHYDTCLVTYKIENKDDVTHKIGLRFMLDTFIGSNDGVPFTLPGSSELCDTQHDFNDALAIPDYIEARETADLKKPGTIVRVQLRVSKRYESPSRVTLGAWPNDNLKEKKDRRCTSNLTLWEVPVLPIRIMQEVVSPEAPADSCVVIYWEEKELKPNEQREMAFAYGLGNLASDTKGELGLTVPSSTLKGSEFTVTALVKNPTRGQKVTISVDEGLELVDSAEQEVPQLPENSEKKDSPVTWKVRAKGGGNPTITVKSSTGGTVSTQINIRERDIFN